MNSKSDQMNNNLLDAAMSLNEAEELVAISENLFKTKLQNLEKQFINATSEYEKEELQKKADLLHADYKKSLQEIVRFVRDTCVPNRR